MQNIPTKTKYARLQWICTLLLGIGMLCVLTRYLATHYYIKAYSDPASWLRSGYLFAENFKTLHLPLGYPAYLWALLHVLDPIQIFWANIPLVILLGVEIGILGYLIPKKNSHTAIAHMIALLAGSFYLLYDPAILTKLTNLYRDPLAHSLMLLSVMFFILYFKKGGRHIIWLAASGVLLGFAYCTREPSIIVVAPMALTGLVFVLQKKIPFWKNVITFSVCLLLGCLPILVQGLLSKEQLSISPYAAHNGRMLPGLHLIALPRTFPSAWHYYTTGFKGFLALAGLTGFIISIFRKNYYISCLMAPCALMYFILYSFYWNFFERYFFTVSLFLLPLAAYGTVHMLLLVFRITPLRNLMYPATSILVLAFILIGSTNLLNMPYTEPLFQIPQARKLQQDITDAVPTNGIILCTRHNLGNTIYAITHRPYANMDRMLYKQNWTDQAIREQLTVLAPDNTPLFLLVEDKPISSEIYQRHMNVIPIKHLQGSDYNLTTYFGANELVLYQLKPWDKHQVQIQLPPPDNPTGIIQIDPLANARIQPIQVSINAQTLPDLYTSGSHYFYHIFTDQSPKIVISLQSENALPDVFPVNILPADEPLDINVGFFSYPSHAGVFTDYPSECITTHPFFMRITGTGVAHLPTPWPNQHYKTTWMLQNPAPNQSITVQIGEKTITIPADRKPHAVEIPIIHDVKQPSMDIPIHVINNQDTDPAFIDIDRIFVAAE